MVNIRKLTNITAKVVVSAFMLWLAVAISYHWYVIIWVCPDYLVQAELLAATNRAMMYDGPCGQGPQLEQIHFNLAICGVVTSVSVWLFHHSRTAAIAVVAGCLSVAGIAVEAFWVDYRFAGSLHLEFIAMATILVAFGVFAWRAMPPKHGSKATLFALLSILCLWTLYSFNARAAVNFAENRAHLIAAFEGSPIGGTYEPTGSYDGSLPEYFDDNDGNMFLREPKLFFAHIARWELQFDRGDEGRVVGKRIRYTLSNALKPCDAPQDQGT